jgi:hypothetical protein
MAVQATVIPSQDTLIGDLLSLDLAPQIVTHHQQQAAAMAAPPATGLDDLLGLGGTDSLVSARCHARYARMPCCSWARHTQRPHQAVVALTTCLVAVVACRQ